MTLARVVVAASVVLVVAGCSSGVTGTGEPTGSSSGGGSGATTSAVPGSGTSFDPCTQIPDADVTAFGLDPSTRKNADVGSGGLARGCSWANKDVGVAIQVGDQTVADLAARSDFLEVKTYTVDGVDAVRFRTDNTGNCTVAVTSQRVAVTIITTNTFASLKTVDACTVADGIATKLVPLLPT